MRAPFSDSPGLFTNHRLRVGLMTTTIAVGCLYIALQWALIGSIDDAVFIGMLIGGTASLLTGMNGVVAFLSTAGLQALLADPASAERNTYDELIHGVLSPFRMLVGGFVYGLVLSTAPFVFGVWPEQAPLAFALAAFLFLVNFATGSAFAALIAFFAFAMRLGARIPVNLWQTASPGADFLLRATRRITLLTAWYAALCNSSILFSRFPVNSLVVAYFFFSALTIIAALVIPTLPLAHRLNQAKVEALERINGAIFLCFYESLAAGAPLRAEVDFEKFKLLLELRERVESLSTWPFRARAVATGLSVVTLSSIPVVLQLILERLVAR